jgi:hypothetical protein
VSGAAAPACRTVCWRRATGPLHNLGFLTERNELTLMVVNARRSLQPVLDSHPITTAGASRGAELRVATRDNNKLLTQNLQVWCTILRFSVARICRSLALSPLAFYSSPCARGPAHLPFLRLPKTSSKVHVNPQKTCLVLLCRFEVAPLHRDRANFAFFPVQCACTRT